jgi:hypothetical protein
LVEKKNISRKMMRSHQKVLAVLLGLQVLLPFLLYYSLKNDMMWAAYAVSAVFFISILVVVWLK